jgi:hypothetical protein
MTKKCKWPFIFALLTIVGSLLALAGDLLIGWVDPGALGTYGMIQSSWSQIPAWRPALSLLLASAAFPLFLPGLLVLSRRIAESFPKAGKAFCITSFFAGTGWLFIHAGFCIPEFTYKYVYDAGYPDLAVRLTDKMLYIFTSSIIVSSLSMLTAFAILFTVIITGKTIYSRWCVLMNPIIIVMISTVLTYVFPTSIFIGGVGMCKMNLGMFLFFIVVGVHEYRNMDAAPPVILC